MVADLEKEVELKERSLKELGNKINQSRAKLESAADKIAEFQEWFTTRMRC